MDWKIYVGFTVTTTEAKRMFCNMFFFLLQVCFLRIIGGRLLGFVTWTIFVRVVIEWTFQLQLFN
jgi:hypothetical protein